MPGTAQPSNLAPSHLQALYPGTLEPCSATLQPLKPFPGRLEAWNQLELWSPEALDPCKWNLSAWNLEDHPCNLGTRKLGALEPSNSKLYATVEKLWRSRRFRALRPALCSFLSVQKVTFVSEAWLELLFGAIIFGGQKATLGSTGRRPQTRSVLQ